MRLTQYFKETRGEVKNITFPSRRDLMLHGTLVIALSILVGAFLGLLDLGFQEGLTQVLNRF